MRAVALIVLVACAPPLALEQPNTVQACTRAVECTQITDDQHAQCVTCLEHVDQDKLDALTKQYGPMPELETAPCDQVALVLEHTDIGTCIADGWVWR